MKATLLSIKSEFGKMKSPTRKEVLHSSGILLIFVLVSAILLGVLDYFSSFILLLF